MKKSSLLILLGLFSCQDIYGDSYYKVISVKDVTKTNPSYKYEITLDHPSELTYTHFLTDSLYSVGDSIKIGK